MKQLSVLATILIALCSCSGKTTTEVAPEPLLPEKATLISPAQNEICTQGSNLSSTQSVITLKWGKGANTDKFEVNVKNLETGTVISQTTVNTQLDVTLLRNAPYSWSVISQSTTANTTSQSSTWKFYNAGIGMVNYAPFPAELVYPAPGQTINANNGKISLNWTSSDVDNDIVSYTVYMGLSQNPPLFKSDITTTSLPDVTVIANNTYYWKVASIDSKGNSSNSIISVFKVN